MTTGRALRLQFRSWGIALVGAVATLVAVFAGQREVADLTGGVFTMWASVVLGMNVTARAAIETDPSLVLKLDLFLVLIVALGLSGVALIGLAIV